MKKIVFAGLDNSGKTSILYTLGKKFSLLSSIRPTIDYNQIKTLVRLLGMDIISWDLGGQKKYRERFFKEKYGVFLGSSILYYVIDIQDEERFDESLEYLKNILELFENMDEHPPIIICFHKVDPDMRKDEKILGNISTLTEKINIITENFDVEFYNTSIHDEPTVIKAFSGGLRKISEKSKIINDLLKEYAKATFSSAVLLLDENCFIIGAHYTKKQYLEICQTVAPRFATALDRLADYRIKSGGLNLDISFNDEALDLKERKALIFMLDYEIEKNLKIYIVSLSKNEKTRTLSLKYLPELAGKIKNFITAY